jgi:hypothetical protein
VDFARMRKGEQMRTIDADGLKARLDYCTTKGMGSTIAFTFKHIVDEQPTIEPLPTEWLGNHTPFRCKRCGHYSDTRTPYCAYCGKKAINV